MSDVTDIVGTVVTAGAVLVGGAWAYFRFYKERTYRPRIDVRIYGQWLEPSETGGLHVRVEVKNIGNAVVYPQERGTALTAARIADPIVPAPMAVTWELVGAYPLLAQHDWIEPGEIVTEDLLLRLPVHRQPVRVEAQLLWKWHAAKRAAPTAAVKTDPIDGTTVIEGRIVRPDDVLSYRAID
ncbi:MAG TPA: hypothetical protein VG708_01235 [Mycobacteriales bacterium]|nr:hypothetical protein [Mycobacteriales bacterium]